MHALGTIHGLWTLILLIAFVAIVVWAWSGKRRSSFEDAGRIPFEDDRDGDGDGDGAGGRDAR